MGYWTVGHCELGPRCVYIHQEVSNAMAKQIVANNGELPPSVALSVPVKLSRTWAPRTSRACPGAGGHVQATSIRPSAMQQLQSGRKDLDWSTMGTLASVATARDGAQTTFNWTSESSSSRVLCTSSHL